MAIEGDGWFGVKGENSDLYTRAGNFTFDKNSNLVTPDGFYVLGSMADNIDFKTKTLKKPLLEVPLKDVNKQEKLSFPKTLKYPPIASTTASYVGNIGTDDVSVSMGASIVDPQGNRNNLKLLYTKSPTQTLPGSQWDVVATTQSLDGTTIYDKKTGIVSFNSTGGLESSTLTTIDNNGQAVSIDLGSAYTGVTSISSIPASSSSTTDGSIGGDLVGYDVNKYGEVVATFTNGLQSAVAQIAVYHFNNNSGLERDAGTRFRASANSGDAKILKDANGVNSIAANLKTHRLENSNVTLEKGLTELIVLQRSYDASSKSISTANEMMQKALNMHR